MIEEIYIRKGKIPHPRGGSFGSSMDITNKYFITIIGNDELGKYMATEEYKPDITVDIFSHVASLEVKAKNVRGERNADKQP